MIIVDQLDAVVQSIAQAVDKPEDHVRLVICLVLHTPLGFFFNTFITSPGFPRYLFSLVVGAFFQIYMFRDTVYHIYIYSLVAYAIMNLLPR